MGADLAGAGVRATFGFAWLYNDLAYCRNHDPQTDAVVNNPENTASETYEHLVAGGHELAYHSHPPYSVIEGPVAYCARPNATCDDDDRTDLHRWSGFGAGQEVTFSPGVF